MQTVDAFVRRADAPGIANRDAPLHSAEVPGFLVSLWANYLGAVQDLQQRCGDIVQLRHPKLLFVYDLELIRQMLLTDAANYPRGEMNRRAVRALAGMNLQTLHGDDWKRIRAFSEPFYAHEYFDERLPEADRVIREALEGLRDRGDPVDLHVEIQRLALEIVNALYLKLDRKALAEILPGYLSVVSREFLRYAAIPFWRGFRNLPLSRHRADRRSRERLDELITAKIRSWRENSRSAEPSCFLEQCALRIGEPGFPCTETEILDHAKGILLGSTLGFGLSLMWGFYFACETPHIQERVRRDLADARRRLGPFEPRHAPELTYTRGIHLESLRLLPPAHTIQRQSVAERWFQGRCIPARTPILIPIYAIHRDSRYWEHPTAFMPERFGPLERWPSEPPFMPFGLGRRSCIARKLSLSTASLVFARFFEAFELRLARGFRPIQRLDPEISTANGMWMELRPRLQPLAGADEPLLDELA